MAATETIPTVSRISRDGFEKFRLKRAAIDVLVKRIKPRTGDIEDLLLLFVNLERAVETSN
jgi:hypothetical protein